MILLVHKVELGKKYWEPEPEWKELTVDFVKEAVEMLIDESNYPVLLSCR